jgi:UDP-glucose 4-epimerase
MTRTALVTGAAGFIGSTLVRALFSAGFRVHGLDVFPPAEHLQSLVAEWTVADLSRGIPAGLQPPEVAFHCAGSATVGASFDDPAADFRANVATLESLLAGLGSKEKTSVVLISSAAVYGMQSSMPIPENAALDPISPYGEHKLLAEKRLRDSGFNVAVVRLFSVYGPGLRKQLLWDACRKLLLGTPSFGGDGSEVRDWVHVEDAAALLMRAAAVARRSCPVFNGGAGVPVAVRDVLQLLAQNLGCTTPLRFSGERRRGDPPALVAAVDAARGIGWSPKVSLSDGIAGYADWFRSLAR